MGGRPLAAARAAGPAASTAPVTIATTIIGNRKPSIAVLPSPLRNADDAPGITGGAKMQAAHHRTGRRTRPLQPTPTISRLLRRGMRSAWCLRAGLAGP